MIRHTLQTMLQQQVDAEAHSFIGSEPDEWERRTAGRAQRLEVQSDQYYCYY